MGTGMNERSGPGGGIEDCGEPGAHHVGRMLEADRKARPAGRHLTNKELRRLPGAHHHEPPIPSLRTASVLPRCLVDGGRDASPLGRPHEVLPSLRGDIARKKRMHLRLPS
jgi:hypothetical protein